MLSRSTLRRFESSAWALLATLGVLGCLATCPAAAFAQTLDEAVTRQLQTVGPRECAELIDFNSANLARLTGELLNICQRGIPAGGTPGSGTSGGGAATPGSIPNIVKRRLNQEPEEESTKQGEKKHVSSGPKVSASGDSLVAAWANGINLFFSSEYERGDRDVTRFEDGYESDAWRVALGIDYRFLEKFVAGLAVDFSNRNGDFKGGGDFEDNIVGFLAFGSYEPTVNSSVQVTLGYSRGFHDRDRPATFSENDSNGNLVFTQSGIVEADFNADRVQFGALANYDYHAGNLTLSPRAGFDLGYVAFGSYSESGSSGLQLKFYDDDQISVASIMGAALSAVISTPIGVLIPQASLDWKHEFKNDQRKIEVSFVQDLSSKRFKFKTEPPDRDYAVVNAGIAAVLRGGVQVFTNYRVILEHSFLENHAITVGGRFEF